MAIIITAQDIEAAKRVNAVMAQAKAAQADLAVVTDFRAQAGLVKTRKVSGPRKPNMARLSIEDLKAELESRKAIKA